MIDRTELSWNTSIMTREHPHYTNPAPNEFFVAHSQRSGKGNVEGKKKGGGGRVIIPTPGREG